MASGHVNRTSRPNTRLHRPICHVKKALANSEPSTHGGIAEMNSRGKVAMGHERSWEVKGAAARMLRSARPSCDQAWNRSWASTGCQLKAVTPCASSWALAASPVESTIMKLIGVWYSGLTEYRASTWSPPPPPFVRKASKLPFAPTATSTSGNFIPRSWHCLSRSLNTSVSCSITVPPTMSVLLTNSECDAPSDSPIPPFRTANLLKSLTCFQHGVARYTAEQPTVRGPPDRTTFLTLLFF
jgi:hypothetical protein